MSTAIAARTTGKEQIDYVEVELPEVSPGTARVAIEHVALCGTDLHIWENDYVTELPIIQGHELVGRIEELGEGVTKLAIGDRVVIDPLQTCGECRACRTGRQNVCPNLTVLGCYCDGGLVEQLVWDAAKLHPVPESLPGHIAALAEPTAIALQAVRRGRAAADDIVLVLGCGPIGLLATLSLRDLGATVIAVDTIADRVELAREFGANEAIVVDPTAAFPSPEVAAAIAKFAGSDGPSLVIEATGVPASLTNAVHAVGAGGRIVQVGISARPTSFPLNLLAFKEIDLMGSRNSRGLMPETLTILERHPDTAANLVTHRFGFGELSEAFEAMRDRSQKVGKIVIDLVGSACVSADAAAKAEVTR